jgi:hypothetical protein
MEELVLETLSKDGTIENSRDFASKHNLDYEQFVGVLKSLEFGAQKLIKTTVKEATVISLTKEAQDIVKNGAAPEVKVFNIIPASGRILKSEITVSIFIFYSFALLEQRHRCLHATFIL